MTRYEEEEEADCDTKHCRVSQTFADLNLESLNCFSQVEKRTCSCTRVAQEGLGKKGGDSSCLKIRGRGTPGASENKR